MLWRSGAGWELTESAAGGPVLCRERQDFAGHWEVAMSTSRNTTPLYEAIRSLVLSARQSAARGVNLLQVYTNYEIGRRIVEQEQKGAERAQYGKELLNELAARLTGEFGNGFSVSSLSRITGQNSFQSISRRPDLAWVTGALYYFSAGFLIRSEPLGRA